MPITLSASIEGVHDMSRQLLGIERRVGNLNEPMRQIGSEVMHSIDQNYESRGRLFGKWARRKKAYGWPILEKSGKMRGSFMSDVGKRHVIIYNPTPYFKYHQSRKRRNKLPRRVMLKIDERRKLFIQKTIQAHYADLLRRRRG